VITIDDINLNDLIEQEESIVDTNIRHATTDDMPRLLEINDEVDLDIWPEERFNEVFTHQLPIFVICDNNDRILGYIIYLMCLEEARIINFTMAKDYQGRGYGKKLLIHALQQAYMHESRYAILEVRVSNIRALNLYTKFGFRILCVRENYYTDKIVEDGYLMQLELNKLNFNY